eukprot:CAMPEP_0170133782 /NCGR_PEP_ID=MMETSP0033_2-20121228/1537_1 /TAXON_ID=195969 /ORGANISM="Dolichomastix tenuilepis, Strain CCMP3274" /LENGTH=828 /DNA_ID=CAMNT_0010369309 /DNA_START=12 /DNA_END=2498 /DNA_ORIENTATION=+
MTTTEPGLLPGTEKDPAPVQAEDDEEDEFFDPDEDVPASPSPSPLVRPRDVPSDETGERSVAEGSERAAEAAAQEPGEEPARRASDPPSASVALGRVEGAEGAEASEASTSGAAGSVDERSGTVSVGEASAAPLEAGGEKDEDQSELESALMRVKNLDTGHTYQLEKVFKIRDLDTGQVFLVDEGGSPVGREGPIVGSKQSVKDLNTGKAISYEQFQNAIGLSPMMREIHKRQIAKGEEIEEGDEDDEDEEEERAAAAAAAAAAASASSAQPSSEETKPKKKPTKPKNPGRWLKKRFTEASNAVSELASDTYNSLVADTFEPAEFSHERTGGGSSAGSEGELFGPIGVGQQVKVNVHRKLYKEFTEVRLVQELKRHEGAVWTIKFSTDGKHLATAGQDTLVRIWRVAGAVAKPAAAGAGAGAEVGVGAGGGGAGAAAADAGAGGSAQAGTGADAGSSDAPSSEQDESGSSRSGGGGGGGGGGGAGTNGAKVLIEPEPFREYSGHKADVLDLSWSSTHFLLSSSMDKSVRLWHVSMTECLRIFNHNDFVTAIDFNPANDKYFLSGSLDEKVRLWNIPNHQVVDWVDMHEMVTAACFSPDGQSAIVGSYKGKCNFFNMDGYKFEAITQIDVKNTHGQKRGGKKITGLQFMPGDPRKLLVTSNDSRIRVYDGYTLRCKYKGHLNQNSQIKASFSEGAEYIICGSEDGSAFIWSTINSFVPSINPVYTGYRKDKHSSYENISTSEETVTTAVFAPEALCRQAGNELDRQKPEQPTKAAAALLGRERTEEEREAMEAGEAAFIAAASRGQVFLAAGDSGTIRLYRNFGFPHWI